MAVSYKQSVTFSVMGLRIYPIKGNSQTQKPADAGYLRLVPKVGIEPTRPCGHWILSPARLPVPPLRRWNSNGDFTTAPLDFGRLGYHRGRCDFPTSTLTYRLT